ncbi:MAG: carboxypeptidase-like regulatory domain-containing protein [Bacteroidales bacterium]|nr:carboxypeptidase-like regulatory domain-containing protein [Bacteroidales bacterium]
MRKLIIAVITIILPVVASAQNVRSVRGVVVDAGGRALPAVTLKVDGCQDEFKTDRLGRFEIQVPYDSRYITASLGGYVSSTSDLSGSFVIVRIQPVASSSQSVQVAVSTATATTVVTMPVSSGTQMGVSEVPEASGEQVSRQEPVQDGVLGVRKQSKYLEKGFYNSFDLSYSWSFNQGCVTHSNIGVRYYTTLHPVEIAYNLGYKFSDFFTLYAGAGFSYNLRYVDWCDTVESSLYPDFKSQPWDIPVHLGMRFSFCYGAVRPFLMLQGGMYVMNVVPDFEAGAGVSFLTGRRSGFNLVISGRNVVWPHFSAFVYKGFPLTIAPTVKIGYNF